MNLPTSSTNLASYITTTATTPPVTWRKVRLLIDTPAFLQIEMFNGTRMNGRFTRYSDPMQADYHGAFVAEDVEGVKTYILWAAILRVTVFPLNVTPPADVAAPTP